MRSAFSAAKALPVANTCVKPVAVGAPVPPPAAWPHATTDPSDFSAAKAVLVEKSRVKPVAVGAPVPPLAGSPQAVMAPSALRAANADRLGKVPALRMADPARWEGRTTAKAFWTSRL